MSKNFWEIDKLFDSHAHLQLLDSGMQQSIDGALSAGVENIVDVAVDYKSSLNTLKNGRNYPEVILPTAGIDPEVLIPGAQLYWGDAAGEKEIEMQLENIKSLLAGGGFSMVGECGLDYYWLETKNLQASERERSKSLQNILFKNQILLAKEYNLPITVHSRGAEAEVLEILIKYCGSARAVLHSFTGTYKIAREAIDNGFKIGVNGIVTYKSAADLKTTIKKLLGKKQCIYPQDFYNKGIYLETDSPFLIPSNIKYRPLYNSPLNLKYIQQFLFSL